MGDELTEKKEQLMKSIAEVNEQITALKATIAEKVDNSAKAPSCFTDGAKISKPVKKKGKQMLGHFQKICSVAWFPESPCAATASQDGHVIYWDFPRQNKKAMIHLKSSWVMFAEVNEDKTFTGGLDNTVSLWKTPSGAANEVQGAPVEFSGHAGYVQNGVFLPGTSKFITVSGDTTGALWDVNMKKKGGMSDEAHWEYQYKGHEKDVLSVCLKPGSSDEFITSSTDGTIMLWSVGSGKPTGTMRIKSKRAEEPDVNRAKYQSNGFGVGVATEHDNAMLLDTRTRGVVNTFESTDDKKDATAKYGVAFSSSGRLMFVAGASQTTEVWDVTKPDQKTPVSRFQNHTNRVTDVAVNKEGSACLTVGWDSVINLYAL